MSDPYIDMLLEQIGHLRTLLRKQTKRKLFQQQRAEMWKTRAREAGWRKS